MNKKIILGIHVKHRSTDAVKIQKLLTGYGCSIQTRIGLHDTDENGERSEGIILLELCGNTDETSALEKELLALPDVEVQKMLFTNET
jgi:hypothetical protein